MLSSSIPISTTFSAPLAPARRRARMSYSLPSSPSARFIQKTPSTSRLTIAPRAQSAQANLRFTIRSLRRDPVYSLADRFLETLVTAGPGTLLHVSDILGDKKPRESLGEVRRGFYSLSNTEARNLLKRYGAVRPVWMEFPTRTATSVRC